MENESFFDNEVVDITPRKRRNWWKWLIALVVVLFLFGSSLLSIYIDALWFSSEGYSSVYWYPSESAYRLAYWSVCSWVRWWVYWWPLV